MIDELTNDSVGVLQRFKTLVLVSEHPGIFRDGACHLLFVSQLLAAESRLARQFILVRKVERFHVRVLTRDKTLLGILRPRSAGRYLARRLVRRNHRRRRRRNLTHSSRHRERSSRPLFTQVNLIKILEIGNGFLVVLLAETNCLLSVRDRRGQIKVDLTLMSPCPNRKTRVRSQGLLDFWN